MTPNSGKVPPADRALRIALRVSLVVLVLAVAGFGTVYYLGQRADAGPTLVQRQVTTAEQQVRSTPNNLNARLALAQAYQAAGRLDDALAQYDQILKAVPDHRAGVLGRGGVLLAKGDLDGAATMYRKITSVAVKGEFAGADPQLEEAHYFLAVIASRQDRQQTAVAEAKAALLIEKTDSDAWYLLGAAQLKLGQTSTAVASLQRAVLFVPTGWAEPYGLLAQAYTKLGRAPQAEYASAMQALSQKRYAEAERRLTALTSGPVAAEASIGLALIDENRGRQQDAVGWYRKALAADPTNMTAIESLSRLGITPTGAPSVAPAVPGKGHGTRPAPTGSGKG